MEVWSRLKSEPTKLRAAIGSHSKHRIAAVVRRLTVALDALDPNAQAAATSNGHGRRPPRPVRYGRPAEIASEYGVHPKTLQRWLATDLPEALFKRRRLTLVDLDRYAEWKARFGRRRVAG